jgi:abhydrolase domain-containing protein 13
MHLLYEKAIEHNNDCLFVDFPNGMHMDTWYSGGDRYWRTIQFFLQRFAPDGTSRSLSAPSKKKDKKGLPMFTKFFCGKDTKFNTNS